MVQISKQSFWGRLCSERNPFSRAAGARRANFKFFFSDSLMSSQMLSNDVLHARLRAPLLKRLRDLMIIITYID